MPLTPLQRKAAWKSACVLKRMTEKAAAQKLGVTVTHLQLVFANKRKPSAALAAKIARFVGHDDFFAPSATEPTTEGATTHHAAA